MLKHWPSASAYRWRKGNLHTHSLWRAGDDFPAMIAEWYRRNGYNFLAVAGHNTLLPGQKGDPRGRSRREHRGL